MVRSARRASSIERRLRAAMISLLRHRSAEGRHRPGVQRLRDALVIAEPAMCIDDDLVARQID